MEILICRISPSLISLKDYLKNLSKIRSGLRGLPERMYDALRGLPYISPLSIYNGYLYIDDDGKRARKLPVEADPQAGRQGLQQGHAAVERPVPGDRAKGDHQMEAHRQGHAAQMVRCRTRKGYLGSRAGPGRCMKRCWFKCRTPRP